MFKRTTSRQGIVDSKKTLKWGGGHQDASDGCGDQSSANELGPAVIKPPPQLGEDIVR